jgi:hypothetical protein
MLVKVYIGKLQLLNLSILTAKTSYMMALSPKQVVYPWFVQGLEKPGKHKGAWKSLENRKGP